ncbi:very short patch repair endonuclease [Halotalea alkalilenta]|uniref:very short patch repair endonuclease n=1 Tax=Halotalea alkalilenta TaxID=376489 RepID=UPI0009ED1418|nr:very short patch repair endonuclease [Halotalea alkalilenta]
MSDVLTPEQRSYCMSQIKGKNTKSEVALRKALWSLGYRYRIRNRLPGRPDLVFKSFRTVIFIDGCFWHKCSDHFVQPKTRTEFWMNKINGNVARDHSNNEALKSEGWQVIRIWEHEIKASLEDSVARVVEVLEEQRNVLYLKDC